jgi:hypothetical protein
MKLQNLINHIYVHTNISKISEGVQANLVTRMARRIEAVHRMEYDDKVDLKFQILRDWIKVCFFQFEKLHEFI